MPYQEKLTKQTTQPHLFIIQQQKQPDSLTVIKQAQESDTNSIIRRKENLFHDITNFKFDKLKMKYNKRFSVADKLTGMPVYFKSNLMFDETRNKLVKDFPKKVISKFNHKNKNNTLAVSTSKKIACVSVSVYPRLKFIDDDKVKSIKSIIYNWLYIAFIADIDEYIREDFEMNPPTVNDIYNIIIGLNEFCFNKELRQYEPLPDEVLRNMAIEIYDKFITNKIFPVVNSLKVARRTITTDDFEEKAKMTNPEYKNKKKHHIILLECNELINKQKAIDWKLKFDHYFKKFPGISSAEFIKKLASIEKKKETYIKELFYKYSKTSEYYVQEPTTSERIKKCIVELTNSGQKITQVIVAQRLEISIRTVIRNWSK